MDPVDRVQVVESAENLRADNAHPFRGLFPPRPDYVVEAPYCQLHDDDVPPLVERLELVVARNDVGLMKALQVPILVVEPGPVRLKVI